MFKQYKQVSVVGGWLATHPRLESTILGICLGLPFIASHFILLALAAIIYLYFKIKRTALPNLVLDLFIIFAVKAAITLSFFWSVYPIEWLNFLSPVSQIGAIFLYWAFASLMLGSAGIYITLLLKLSRKFSVDSAILIPIQWAAFIVLSEYLAAIVFSIGTYGSGGYINGFFSFGSIGYLFTWLPPLAYWGGVYAVGLGGLVLLFGLAMAWDEKSKTGLTYVGFVFLFYILTSGLLQYEGKPAQAAVIETDQHKMPPFVFGEMSNEARQLENLVQTAIAVSPDYVVMPEGSSYLQGFYGAESVGVEASVAAWKDLHPSTTAIFVDTAKTNTNVGFVLRSYTFNLPDTNKALVDSKRYLVPLGEYLPYITNLWLGVFTKEEIKTSVSSLYNYVLDSERGVNSESALAPKILFCFESVSPMMAYKKVKSNPSPFIVHPISHAWFNESSILESQLDQMLKLQSIWSGVPIVSAGNAATSKVYTPLGDVLVPSIASSTSYGRVRLVEILI